MKKFERLILTLRSTPVVWVSTGDPVAVLDFLFEAARFPERFGYRRGAPPRPVIVWSPAPTPEETGEDPLQFLWGGWAVARSPVRFQLSGAPRVWEPSLPDRVQTENLIRALWTIVEIVQREEQAGSGNPAIWVMIWAHEAMSRPDVAWALRGRVYEALRGSRHRLVLIAPPGTLPPPLLAEAVAVVEVPPPTIEELEVVVEGAQAYGGPLARMERRAVARALAGLEYHQAEQVLAMVEAQAGPETNPNALLQAILRHKAEILRSMAGLEWLDPIPFDMVGGLDQLKALAQMLRRALEPDAEELGLKLPRGILLAGPPGVGKTLTSRAIAWEMGVPMVRMDLSGMYDSLLGRTEQNLRRALAALPSMAPIVVQVDELEKAIGHGHELDGGTSSRVLGMLLTRMQEMPGPVLFVATVNRIELLPPELVERFDERYWVDLPGPVARREIISIHLRKRGYDLPDVDVNGMLDALVRATRGHSGRSIEQIIARAHLSACRNVPLGGRPDLAHTIRLAIEIAGRTVPIAQAMADSLREIQKWRSRFEPAASDDPEEALVTTPAAAGPGGRSRGRLSE